MDTSSKTGAVTVNLTVHDVNSVVATCTVDPNSLGNARHEEQQQKRHSNKTTEGNKSNTEHPKTTQENNINTPVLGSTVSKKQYFPFWKILLILLISYNYLFFTVT
jgi:hypothetical protein